MHADPTLYPNSNISKGEKVEWKRPDGSYITQPVQEATHDEMIEKRSFRASKEMLSELNEIMQSFIGTHNFHNFTVNKKFTEPNASRYIMEIKGFAFLMQVDEPFIKKDTEWISIKLHGQSFMLHQIRKMVGLAIMLIRTKTPKAIIERLFENVKVNVPKAPAVGLLLERVCFLKRRQCFRATLNG